MAQNDIRGLAMRRVCLAVLPVALGIGVPFLHSGDSTAGAATPAKIVCENAIKSKKTLTTTQVKACQKSGVKVPKKQQPTAFPSQSTYLGGNANPTYPAGKPGKLSVVFQAPIAPSPYGTSIPIVFRNNTKVGVAHVDISATALDATGKIVGSGSSQGTAPSVVQPGQWAYAYIFFQSLPAAASKLRGFTFRTSSVTTSFYNTAPIQVTQANLVGTAIAGGVQNTTGHKVNGPISVDVYCLDAAGNPANVHIGFTSGATSGLAPNATDSFQVGFDGTCSSFLVGASGFYP
jgi:hypothetical protein